MKMRFYHEGLYNCYVEDTMRNLRSMQHGVHCYGLTINNFIFIAS